MTIPYISVPVGATLLLINALCMMVLPAETLKQFEDGEGAP